MTTKTTITLSPIKRCYTSPNLQKRCITSIVTHCKYQTNLSLPIPNMISLPSPTTTITVSCERKNLSTNNLPDLVNDILIEEQQRETIKNIAITLRKISDQIDEQIQINNSLSSNHIFAQRTITFIHCLSHILRFFL
ncbi:unnamed protein product [Rotaria sp. Silwood2]|nr:unnamed protein product [Rotaria sp. Silwood2]CAF2827987.1 unnamed protein product [Rotaria sp. Silwood2]CAF3056910.1 unnamed protein product [Rotaria sp. Silwood2]CAF3194223.1 unnamed protein product [Rotaria sp. Silwood2]CAF3903313.1 unnamed protein product [Rotaria sp. Silwood2]